MWSYNFTTIFLASNNHIGTNSIEGYSSNNSAIANYPSPITQKAIGGISVGYPGAINTSVGKSTNYYVVDGVAENGTPTSEPPTSVNYQFTVSGSEKLAVFFIEGSSFVNPIINTNFNLVKLNELNGPLLFIYLGDATLNPGTYNINLNMSVAQSSNLNACDAIIGVYLFPELTFTVQAKQVTYPVSFTETGLPSGSSWGITVNGNTYSSSSNIVNFNEPNGTYYYEVVPPSGYTTSPPTGTFTVSGAPVSNSLLFTKATKGPYRITFTETGLPNGTEWIVESPNTFMYNSTNNTLIFYEPNGTYFYDIFTYVNYYANIPRGNFTVLGASVNISVVFSTTVSQSYVVSFYASGLPKGVSWTVTFNGQTITSTNDYINFTVPNGVYSWTYSIPYPYYSTITPEKITVDNQGTKIIVPVLSKTATSVPLSSSIPPSLLLIIGLIIIVVIVVLVIFILLRKRKRPRPFGQGPGFYGKQPFPPGPPPNYPPSPPRQQHP
ncbi:MAG: hypothetical protein ACP5NL_03910 [Thermoplasmata archaeon]